MYLQPVRNVRLRSLVSERTREHYKDPSGQEPCDSHFAPCVVRLAKEKHHVPICDMQRGREWFFLYNRTRLTRLQ